MAVKNVKSANDSKLKYSPQALCYLKIINDINMEDFERWILENLNIGGGDVMAYAISRDKDINIQNVQMPVNVKANE